jgi:hypothetical protein
MLCPSNQSKSSTNPKKHQTIDRNNGNYFIDPHATTHPPCRVLRILLSVNAVDVAKAPLFKNVPLASAWTIADVTVNEAPGSGTSSSARPSPPQAVLLAVVMIIV